MVVGDLIGSGSSNEKDVLGEVPNLAARLLALAEPNTIVIADSTRRQVGSVFALEDLGFKGLKGFTEPQRAWRVLGENRFKSRFEALRSAETPLVDRQEETRTLASALGTGKKRRRACHPSLRRSRHRQITPDGGAPGFA